MNVSNKILSDITVYMKYAKYNEFLIRRETWNELVTRNKNMHIKKFPDDIITGFSVWAILLINIWSVISQEAIL